MKTDYTDWQKDFFQGKENVCNHCGFDLDNGNLIDTVFGCDLNHSVYECPDCLKLTWSHIYWSKCEKTSEGHYIGF